MKIIFSIFFLLTLTGLNAQIIVGQPEAKKVLFKNFDNVLQIASVDDREIEIESGGITLTKQGKDTYIAKVVDPKSAWMIISDSYYGDTIFFHVKSLPTPMLFLDGKDSLRINNSVGSITMLRVDYPEDSFYQPRFGFVINNWTAKCSCSDKEFKGSDPFLSEELIDALRSPENKSEVTLTITCEYAGNGAESRMAQGVFKL
jgi:hypothetical protein